MVVPVFGTHDSVLFYRQFLDTWRCETAGYFVSVCKLCVRVHFPYPELENRALYHARTDNRFYFLQYPFGRGAVRYHFLFVRAGRKRRFHFQIPRYQTT